MSEFPKKFAFISDATKTVIEIKVASSEGISFIPNPGYTMVEIPMDSTVTAGWLYLFNTDANRWQFYPPGTVLDSDAVMQTDSTPDEENPDAGNGNPPPKGSGG